MTDTETRLECLKAAVRIWETLETAEMDDTATEVLDAAKSFYSWVIGEE